MTDTKLLQKCIQDTGVKKVYLEHKLGLSHQGFYNKLVGKSEFTVKEITILCELLNINRSLREKIFFATNVDEKST